MTEDDGRDLTAELAACIAEMSERNPGLIVLYARFLKNMDRDGQLAFLAGDLREFEKHLSKARP